MKDSNRVLANIDTKLFFHHHTIDGARQHAKFSVHCHNSYEIYFFVRGSGRFIIEGHEFILKPNTLILLNPGELHYYKMDALNEYERYVIIFSGEIINEAFRGELLSPFSAEGESGKLVLYQMNEISLREHMERFSSCQLVPEPLQEILLSSFLQEFLVNIHMIMKESASAETAHHTSRIILEVIEYINKHLEADLSLAKVADKFFISKYHLSRKFHTHVGISYHEYITNKRILKAQQLLSQGMLSYEACSLCGFHDYTTFYRAYRRVTGKSPKTDMH